MAIFAFFATLFFVGLLGVLLGYFLKSFLVTRNRESIEGRLAKMQSDAEKRASETLQKAEKKSQEVLTRTQKEVQEEKQDIKQSQKRLIEKEQYLDGREKELDKQKQKQEQASLDIENSKIEQEKQLQKLSGMSTKQAKELLFADLEAQYRDDLFTRSRKLEQANQADLDEKAKNILVSAIHRYGNAVENDIMSTSVTLPDNDTKGKIIGKEGRNIKAFEKMAGVQLIIDETPGVITISCFDPIRRAIAKKALDALIEDGRIQPARIENFVEDAKENVIRLITEKGKEAASDAGINDLHPELLEILGRLYFRYSYGQNVLQHSVEMAHIAGMLAEQVGADPYVAKAGALLHDIGKATDHEVEGSHVDIGRRILQKYGISEEVIKAMQAHHEEYPYENLESILVQVADAISGGRPGARSDMANMYIKKLEGLERISQTIEGVENAYAISAGREIRIFVNPEKVDDYGAKKIARDVAKRVEQELKYPGEIKVHVIRETRVVDYAR